MAVLYGSTIIPTIHTKAVNHHTTIEERKKKRRKKFEETASALPKRKEIQMSGHKIGPGPGPAGDRAVGR